MIDQHFEIELSINKIIENLNKIPQHTTSVFFMGESGSGKGTLINYLIRNPYLKAQSSPTGEILIKLQKKHHNQTQDIEISQNIKSQTAIPNQTQYKGETFKDFPGFHDNRQQNSVLNQDIINQFYIRDVFSKTNKFKIVFMTSKSGISDRGTQFLHSIKAFCRQFKDIKPILGSICLVVSKAEKHIQPHHIKATLVKIQTELLEQLTSNQKELLRHFVQDSKIQVFHYPEDQGSLDFFSAAKIDKMIQTLDYSHLGEEISINVESKSHLKIHQLIVGWNHQISHRISQFLKNCISDFIELEFLKFEDFEQNKKRLQRFLLHLETLQGVSSQLYDTFLSTLKNTPILGNNKKQSIKSMIKIEELYNLIDFFKCFENEPFDVIMWKEKIYRIKHFVYELIQQPRFNDQIKTQKNIKSIKITSFSCDSEQIQRIAKHAMALNNSQSNSQNRIVVICYILNLNDDISLPGTDLIFICEWLRVPKPIKINLKGQDALYVQQEEGPNTDGTPGLPGKNGGSLIIKNKHYCHGMNKILIDIRGGLGGLGKNGGIVKVPIKQFILNLIKEDISKPTDKKQFMIERETYKFSDKDIMGKIAHVFRSLGTFNEQILQKYSTLNWTKNNFVQTVGGCNGLPGNMGKLQIGKVPYEIQLKKQLNQKNTYGYKQVYEGVYMKEMVFPSIRKEGRPPQKSNPIQLSISSDPISTFGKSNTKALALSTPCKKQTINNPVSVSQFTLDSSSSNQSFLKQEEQKPENCSNFANSINNIENSADLQEQLLLALFKFNEETERKKKEKKQTKKQLMAEQEQHQCHLIQRRHNHHPQDSIRSNDRFVRTTRKSMKVAPKNSQFSQKCQPNRFQEESLISKQENSLLRSQTFQIPRSKDFNPEQNPQFRASRAQTASYQIDQTQLRRRYLETNFQDLSKTQLLELIKMRSQAKHKIISNNNEREKFALMISKELLNEFGKEIATDIGTQVIHNVGKDIVKNVSGSVVKNTGKQIGKEFLIKGSQGLGKSFVGHQLGVETIKQFSHTFSADSIKQIGKKAGEGSVKMQIGIGQTILGISKSFVFQTIISAILASGITDRWLVVPHFESKKVQSDRFNYQALIKPPVKEGLSQSEMLRHWDDFKQLMNHFEKKTLNYLCQREHSSKGSKGYIE